MSQNFKNKTILNLKEKLKNSGLTVGIKDKNSSKVSLNSVTTFSVNTVSDNHIKMIKVTLIIAYQSSKLFLFSSKLLFLLFL